MTVAHMLAALGVLLLCFTMLTLLRRRLRRESRNQELNAQERIRQVRDEAMQRSGQSHPRREERPESITAARSSVESVMADAEELTRRLAALLDNKAARLESLIDQANEAAERLERAADQPRCSVQSQTPSPPADPVAHEVYALADRGLSSLEIARELDEPTGKVELILALRMPAGAALTREN